MAAIQDAVIDDCTLAKKIKQAGYKTWLGLTHNAISQRPYVSLTEIWDMVARTAYTQLFYSNNHQSLHLVSQPSPQLLAKPEY
jgi:hypothetical protein